MVLKTYCTTAKRHNLIYIFSKPCQANVKDNCSQDIFSCKKNIMNSHTLTELSTSSNITFLISLQDQTEEMLFTKNLHMKK